MVFSSLEFLFFYLPTVLAIYFLIPSRYLAARNFALLIVSLLFYGWSEPTYIWIMLLSITVDYTCGRLIGKYRESSPKKAKAALIASVVINLSILGFFKYADFIIKNLSHIPALSHLKPIGIALPVGISFYTFQTMSYTLDVYLGKARVQKNVATFGSYVTMFPQLIAGPIVRYRDVDNELRQRFHTIENAARGVRRFVCGLAKKVLLANTAGVFYNSFVQGVGETPSILGSWMGIVFFAFQIYFDFSGYSDMAIGLGLIMGFNFPENFNYPYLSKSITDFWRRWHITLSTWFREYVYIPLGGNRKGKLRTFINLIIVWFLTGLWHGASWNFVVWGLYFALLLIVEKAFLGKVLERLPQIISHLYALIFIVFGWFIFIWCDLDNPFGYLSAMFMSPVVSSTAIYDCIRGILFLVILVLASTNLPHKVYLHLYKRKFFRVIMCVAIPITILLCTAYLVDSSYNPFLYFRF
ncbi:MAG: MBOAT family protein [Ruminococcaceae bacterium]|nr:MBOAT family protein [Oscillospiraceae bacterium]